MTISKFENGKSVFLALKGRLDTNTSPELEKELYSMGSRDNLVLDFADLEYISSAGLRVLLTRQKKTAELGPMVIKNVCEDIMEVFEITGFADILEIEH